MEEAIQEADRKEAPESEIEACMMQAFKITRKIMDARRDHIRTLEEEMEAMAERKERFTKRQLVESPGDLTKRLSGDEQVHNAI